VNVNFGILVESEENLTWERWHRLFMAAEALGFESIWLSDHFESPHHRSREALETWTALTVAAARTRNIRFGPLVTPITFRHPALLARMATALDWLGGGRLVLGLGAGWNDVEHAAFGLDFPPTAERMDRLEEGIQVILRLWNEGRAVFRGRYYQLDGAEAHPKPLTGRVPILLGGGGERRTLPLVARYADEWDVPGGLSPDALRAKNARLDELCRAIGRDPTTVLRSTSTAYLVYRDERELQRRIDALRGIYPEVAGLRAEDVPPLLESWNWRIGAPDRLAAEFRALAEAGAERIILQHSNPEDLEALEILAREVIPMIVELGAP
jgi:F420-dependent oxidoreductase-like protein